MEDNNKITVTNVELSIWCLTKLMVKLTIASIPASIIIFCIAIFAASILKGLSL